jgi:hypothetical protein
MSNKPEVGLESQLPAGNRITNLTEEELEDITGGGLLKSAGQHIAKGAKFVAKEARHIGRRVGRNVGKGAKATWEFIY